MPLYSTASPFIKIMTLLDRVSGSSLVPTLTTSPGTINVTTMLLMLLSCSWLKVIPSNPLVSL